MSATAAGNVDEAVSQGEFVVIGGERCYAIRDVDQMAPFFMSVVSSSDHWLFVSSTGGLTAGRVSPDTALFPYVTVDKIHESTPHTGCRTIIRMSEGGTYRLWEPFNAEHNRRFSVSRNLYKNVLGTTVYFEEHNWDLQLTFRYSWRMSDRFGFVRTAELINFGSLPRKLEFLDGLQNILPAGTPPHSQANSSNLVDAYKWNELYESEKLAIYTLYSGITDKAEPAESLKANTVFCFGISAPVLLISAAQVERFRDGLALDTEHHQRGLRGAFFAVSHISLEADETCTWRLVADIEQSQADVVALAQALGKPDAVELAIDEDIAANDDSLRRIVASGDGLQVAAEEEVCVHHYANVLFNTLRGGIFHDQYRISQEDFARTITHFNHDLSVQFSEVLDALPQEGLLTDLLDTLRQTGNAQLERLGYDYLPVTFGRRHGDPSRPWNHFTIKLKDPDGRPRLSYQGNWRDIFQNWEALLWSYPEFIESTIAKFVNASTVDGYNPYRITKEGVDWEVEDLDDPWSFIGYWGDHQIIYVLKLLELSERFHPARLTELLDRTIFCYANVPYRIKSFDEILKNSKNTVVFDHALANQIDERVKNVGADGRLVTDANGEVYLVNLVEKLMVPLLAKLGNLVIEGGIWLNTQRPEWNDANNAIVGNGVSAVTLYYMRRYILFMLRLIEERKAPLNLSTEVADWLLETQQALQAVGDVTGRAAIDAQARYALLHTLGDTASRFRSRVYEQQGFSGKVEQPVSVMRSLLDEALVIVDHSIRLNRREDGLYHAYNLLALKGKTVEVDRLYAMLEGQVAILSSTALAPADVASLLGRLFDSEMYRADQKSFMLYPDRSLPRFLDKNQVPADSVAAIPLLKEMLDDSDQRILNKDSVGHYRFNGSFKNANDLVNALDSLADDYGDAVKSARQPILDLYEDVFHHRAFTGRSGGMFGFEGLGSIYWHMVSKLLLAIQENYYWAREGGASVAVCGELAAAYYKVREGLGFNKSPVEFGAFPTDPYSHTPRQAGAQQPGMTGQVKEEVLSRFGELGVRVSEGIVSFDPTLLREVEFVASAQTFDFLDVDDQWQTRELSPGSLAFTWCQVPIVYQLGDAPVVCVSGSTDNQLFTGTSALNAEISEAIFQRNGMIREITVQIPRDQLCRI